MMLARTTPIKIAAATFHKIYNSVMTIILYEIIYVQGIMYYHGLLVNSLVGNTDICGLLTSFVT